MIRLTYANFNKQRTIKTKKTLMYLPVPFCHYNKYNNQRMVTSRAGLITVYMLTSNILKLHLFYRESTLNKVLKKVG